MEKIKITELIIVALFLIGLALTLTHNHETEQTPRADIAEVHLQHNIEIEPAI